MRSHDRKNNLWCKPGALGPTMCLPAARIPHRTGTTHEVHRSLANGALRTLVFQSRDKLGWSEFAYDPVSQELLLAEGCSSPATQRIRNAKQWKDRESDSDFRGRVRTVKAAQRQRAALCEIGVHALCQPSAPSSVL